MKKIIIDKKEIEISDESYNALKESLVKEDNKRFKPKEDKIYWAITSDGEIDYYYWRERSSFDKRHYNTKSCYKTKEEAERALEIFAILREYAWDDITREELENDGIYKYEINVIFADKSLNICWWDDFWSGSNIIFKTGKGAQAVIDQVGYDDFVKYVVLGGIR